MNEDGRLVEPLFLAVICIDGKLSKVLKILFHLKAFLNGN